MRTGYAYLNLVLIKAKLYRKRRTLSCRHERLKRVKLLNRSKRSEKKNRLESTLVRCSL